MGGRRAERIGQATSAFLSSNRHGSQKSQGRNSKPRRSSWGSGMAMTTAVVGFLAIMFRALLPFLTRKLMRLAVSLLPENLRARYDEEWQSYIAEVSDSVPKFCASFSFVFGAAVISRREKYESITKHFSTVAAEVELSVKLVNALVQHLPTLVSAFSPGSSEVAALQLRILADIETMRVESENFSKLRDRLANAAKMSPR